MERRKSRIHGFSLVEMLLVMAILVIFGSFGVGGFVGFRETMFVRENVQLIIQDVSLAQEQAMLVKRDAGDTWIYGVGLDFSQLASGGTYNVFKWCSPFPQFGNSITRSKLLGWDPTTDIGDTIVGEIEGGSEIDWNDLYFPTGDESDVVTDPSTTIDLNTDTTDKTVDYSGDENITPVDPTTEVMGTSIIVGAFQSGYIPIDGDTGIYGDECQVGASSMVEVTGEAADKFTDAGNIQILSYHGEYPIQYVVFEAVTGKAFLYDSLGYPVNYTNSGSTLLYDDSMVLDILITRDFGTKFDVVSIYPSSGTVIHHVYSSDDLTNDTDNIITVNGRNYKRFGIFDDINSFREEPWEGTE